MLSAHLRSSLIWAASVQALAGLISSRLVFASVNLACACFNAAKDCVRCWTSCFKMEMQSFVASESLFLHSLHSNLAFANLVKLLFDLRQLLDAQIFKRNVLLLLSLCLRLRRHGARHDARSRSCRAEINPALCIRAYRIHERRRYY